MRFIVVLATIFSACCCLSILNLFSFHKTGKKFDLLHGEKKALLNNTLTDEEILACKNFMPKTVKDLNQRPTEEKFQDILSQCSLFLRQNSKLLEYKDEKDSTQSPSFENNRNQEHDSTTEEHSATESSYEVNVSITGANENPTETSERENYGNSTSEPMYSKNEDLKEKSLDRKIKPTTESSGLWSFFFGSKGTETAEATPETPRDHEELQTISTDINSKPITKSSGLWSLLFWDEDKNKSNSTEKPTIETENQKTGVDNVILNSTSTSWSLWNYLFGASDTKNSSNEIRPSGSLKSGPITESSIYFENSTDLENSTTEMTVWNLVMPGTKWCGSGSTAENDDDLGYFEDVDRCCRAHDKCDDLMVPRESKYNLTNTSPFTVLNCKCDDELYDCLSEIDSVTSNTVGNTFFNIFGRMCYMLDYPRICKKYYTLLGCLEYVIDETAEKVFQWKPARKYLKMPFTISG